MGIQKGLYIEQKKNRSVFLMSDGRFIHGRPVSTLEIGEEGSFYPMTAKSKWSWRPIFAPALAAVATLGLFLSAVIPSEDAFAYVQLEMNSSIEFGVDEAIRVVSIRELDKGGQKLIDKLGEWQGETLDILIERSIAISEIDETEKVTITTAAEKGDDAAGIQLEKMVMAASDAAVAKDIDVHVKKATFAQWEKSIEENIPVGQKVENYTSIESKEQFGTGSDSQTEIDNEIKALKTKKNQSHVKNKAMGKELHANPLAESKADKRHAPVKKKKAIEQPLKKNIEPPSPAKTKKFVPPAKAEKVKPAGDSPKAKVIEIKTESAPTPPKKATPAANGQSGSVPAASNPEIKTAENQIIKPAEKVKPKLQTKPKAKEKAQKQLGKKTKSADMKPEKPVKAEVRHSQNQQGENPVQTPKGKAEGEKQEQK